MGIVAECAALRKENKKLKRDNATKTQIISDSKDEIKLVRGDNEFLKNRLSDKEEAKDPYK
ncbi:hypothetical protein LCGC14_2358140 [marine sediment metagenome]|uniref:Uncharacterized protein n=1 Tax=marine sediment metagenome TaxID=412755 RepID=A0A0F9EJV3_9ZZZZ